MTSPQFSLFSSGRHEVQSKCASEFSMLRFLSHTTGMTREKRRVWVREGVLWENDSNQTSTVEGEIEEDDIESWLTLDQREVPSKNRETERETRLFSLAYFLFHITHLSSTSMCGDRILVPLFASHFVLSSPFFSLLSLPFHSFILLVPHVMTWAAADATVLTHISLYVTSVYGSFGRSISLSAGDHFCRLKSTEAGSGKFLFLPTKPLFSRQESQRRMKLHPMRSRGQWMKSRSLWCTIAESMFAWVNQEKCNLFPRKSGKTQLKFRLWL